MEHVELLGCFLRDVMENGERGLDSPRFARRIIDLHEHAWAREIIDLRSPPTAGRSLTSGPAKRAIGEGGQRPQEPAYVAGEIIDLMTL